MENRKGSGIFLGVVSVATLVVAIIGATFAYFSASVTGEGTVDARAYEFSAGISIRQVLPSTTSNGLIPIDPDVTVANAPSTDNTRLMYAVNQAANKCIDDNGFQVCALYEVTVTNNATQQITLGGRLIPSSNTNSSTRTGATPFKNLQCRMATADTASGRTGMYVLGTAMDFEKDTNTGVILTSTDNIQGVNLGTLIVNGATISEESGHEGEIVPGTNTAYILLYLNENGDQSSEMGAEFSGQIVYTSQAGNGNQLTGTFTVAAEPNEP